MEQFKVSIKYFWPIILLPAVFYIFSISFNHFKVLHEKSVLAMADSAYMEIFIKDFHLSKKYGNEYRVENRTNNDRAQKHKIHHILYAIFAHFLYIALLKLYNLVGISANQALYSINAIITCCNLALLYSLLRHFVPKSKNIAVYMLLYAFSLSTWVYASVPEHWPFSTTLILLFMYLFYIKKMNYTALSVLLGVFMLSNVVVGYLALFLIIGFFKNTDSIIKSAAKAISSLAVTITTWALLLLGFSFFDNSLTPWNFIKYSAFHKKIFVVTPPFYDPYTWKVILTNLFINTIATNQSQPGVPPESILYTIQQSKLGIVAIVLCAALLSCVFWGIFKFSKAKFLDKKETIWTLLKNYEFHLILYGAGWIVVCYMLMSTASFMYSTCFLPILVILIARFLNEKQKWQNILLYCSVFFIIVNNIFQVLKFRAALEVLSS